MRINVELADVGRDVEKERKPAKPAEELHLTDHSYPPGKSPNGIEYLFEECEKARIVCRWWTIEPGIPLFDIQAADEQC
jgi:hypothetical protein